MVTDKNKEQFEKWFIEYAKDIEYLCYAGFGGGMFPDSQYLDEAPFEMQIGVYLAYYDSLDIHIDSELNYDMVNECITDDWGGGFWHDNDYIVMKGYYKTRNEAYKEAFKKANELINRYDRSRKRSGEDIQFTLR